MRTIKMFAFSISILAKEKLAFCSDNKSIEKGTVFSVLSRWRDLQKPNSIGVLSEFLGRGADRRWGFGASWVEG